MTGRPARYWHYHLIKVGEDDGDPVLEMREVHFMDGKPIGHGPSCVMGDDRAEVLRVLEMMRAAAENDAVYEVVDDVWRELPR